MAKRKIIECDICDKEITSWEKIRIKEYYIGYVIEGFGCIYPNNTTQSKYIYICPDCIEKIKEYCTREMSV